MTSGEPGQRTIYVRAVVDTDLLVQQVAAVPDAPAVAVAADSAALIVTSTAAAAVQPTSGLAVIGQPGDTLRIYAVSGSDNFEQAALLASVRSAASAVVGPFALVELAQSPMAPETADDDPADPDQDFWFWQAAIGGQGTQDCSLVLAVYDRDEAGEPRFAGLYRWGLQLTVAADDFNPHQPEEQTS